MVREASQGEGREEVRERKETSLPAGDWFCFSNLIKSRLTVSSLLFLLQQRWQSSKSDFITEADWTCHVFPWLERDRLL